MDAILSRAGLSAAQQRALCLDTIRDEVQNTRTNLEDVLVSLRRLEEVVRLAKSVDKSRTLLNTLAPDVQSPLAAMASVGMQIGPLLDKVKAGMISSSGFELEEPSTTQANNESMRTTEANPTTEIRSTVLPTSASRPIEPSPDSFLRDSTEASAPRDQARDSSPSLSHKRKLSTSAMEERQPSSNSFLRSAQLPSTGDTTDVDIKLEVAGGWPCKRRALERHSHTSREPLNVTESLESRQLQIPAEEQEGSSTNA